MAIPAGRADLPLSAVSGVLHEVSRVFADGRWRVVDIGADGDVVSLRIRFAGTAAAMPVAALYREGDYWTIGWAGRVSRLKDVKGLWYLRELLSRPGVEVHALQLATSADGGVREGRGPEPGLVVGDAGDAGQLLDETARSAYRRRLVELRAELAEAEADHDRVRAERARLEIDALTQQLAQAFGLGGRARRAGSVAERARINVTRSLRAVIARIAEAFPDLGHHLDTAVRTGIFSVYEPGPQPELSWRLRANERRSHPPNASWSGHAFPTQ